MKAHFFLIVLICSFFEVASATLPGHSDEAAGSDLDKTSVSSHMSVSPKVEDLAERGDKHLIGLGSPALESLSPSTSPLSPEECTLEEMYLFDYYDNLKEKGFF